MNFGAIPAADIDEDSIFAVACHAEYEIPGEYERQKTNVAHVGLGAVIEGGVNPSHGNNGHTLSYTDPWYCVATQTEDLTYLGKLTLDEAVLTSFLRLYLWEGDDREYYNYKITASADDETYTTLFDGTGSGINYKGRQDVEFERGEYKYFKVYGSGNTINEHFHVAQIEVYPDWPAKRFRIDAAIDTERPARDVIDDMLASFGGFITLRNGKVSLNCDSLAPEPSVYFNAANIVGGEAGVTLTQIPHSEKPNRVRVYYTDPWQGNTRADVTYDDHEDQSATGQIRQKEISLLYITNPAQARRMAKAALETARDVQWIAQWTAGLNAAKVEPGDIAPLTLESAGWTNKRFRVTSVEEDPATGSRVIVARERLDYIYGDAGGGARYSTSQRTTIQDPTKRPPLHVTGLALNESHDLHKDGTWLP
ncbi:MAG TPA: phage tail protein, partial [bacterium]|nr:phage tail protein [bacterium]